MLAFPFIYDKTIVDRIRAKAKRAVKEAKKAQPDFKPRSDSKKKAVAGVESLDGPMLGLKGAFGVDLVKYMATMKVWLFLSRPPPPKQQFLTFPFLPLLAYSIPTALSLWY